MPREPVISFLWLSVVGSSYIPVVWCLILTLSCASPDMPPVKLYLIMEVVIDGEVEPGLSIDLMHDLLEGRTMPFLRFTGIRIRNEEIGVYHFMQQRLLDFIARPKLQQRL